MKVQVEKTSRKRLKTSIELYVDTVEKLDKKSEETGIPRQVLINAILDQVLADKNFTLVIKD